MTLTSKLDAILAQCRAVLEEELRRKGVTPGPWDLCTTQYQQSGYPFAVIHYADKRSGNDIISAHVRSGPDATFIATSRTLTPRLARATITAIEALRSGVHGTLNLCPCWQCGILQRIADEWEEKP